jgi:hypothetical protein
LASFEGGSRIFRYLDATQALTCSSGFAWTSAQYGTMMLTAGHCTTNPGDEFSWSGDYMAAVRRDTWANGSGSILYDGEYRGDLSLVEIRDGARSTGYVHTGGPPTRSTGWTAPWSRVGRRGR